MENLGIPPEITVGDLKQDSPHRYITSHSFNKPHTYSEDNDEIFGRNIAELIDEENQDSSDRLRDDLEEDSKDHDS